MTKRGEHPSPQALEHMCKAMQERRDKGFISPMKGKTFEEVCGPERAKEIKARISKLAHARMMGTANPFYGKHHTDETKRKIAEFHRGKPNPKSEEARRKLSQTLKGRVFSEEHRRNLSNAKKGKPSPWKGKHPTEETRRKMKEAKVGFIPWNKGKRLRPDQIRKKPEGFGQKISAARKAWFAKPENMRRYREEILPKGFTKERSAKISAASKGKIITAEMRFKVSQTKKRLYKEGKIKPPFPKGTPRPDNSKWMKEHVAQIQTPEARKKRSEKQRGRKQDPEVVRRRTETRIERYKDPVKKAEMMKKYWESCKRRPTSFEKQIIELIEEHALPFRYVGDGRLLIGYKNPDFISTDDRKLIIETYHNPLHPQNYEQIRKDYFEPKGYNIIFLDDHDLKRKDWKEHCFSKIQAAVEEMSLGFSGEIKVQV